MNKIGNNTGSIVPVAVSVAVLTSQTPIVYGTPVTLTITVTAPGGTTAPIGNVEIFDNSSHDLGPASFVQLNGKVATYTFTTLAKTFNVATPLTHTITANYSASGSYVNGTATLSGGEMVTPKPVTLYARANAKTSDGSTTAAAQPSNTGDPCYRATRSPILAKPM